MAMNYENSDGGIGDMSAVRSTVGPNGNGDNMMDEQVTDGLIVKGQ